MMEPAVGLRVVRGPDWEWEDQDGGEGFVGTVVELEEGGVIVQWDVGQRFRYRCGRDNKFDLRVFDSGPVPKSQQTIGVDCDWCQEEDLVWCVWRCTRCLDYYLCNQCYHNDRHSIRHPFFRISSTSDLTVRKRVSNRQEAQRVPLRGIFAGARVTRGHDWRWGNQDGGMSGIAVAVKGWRNETKDGVVEVQWEGNPHKNVYRVGHKGKVDLKCLVPGEGGWYSPEHLPILGLREETEGGSEGGEFEFAAGDTVRVDLDLESAKLMQEGHGGWVEGMNACIRDVGLVILVCEDGDVEVRYISNSVFTFNPVVLVKVDIPFHVPGKAVRVLDDMMKVNQLQSVGPGWNDDIVLTLGMVGLVTKRSSSGDVQATVNGHRWHYHPQCLEPIPSHLDSTDTDVVDVDRIALRKVLTILEHGDPQDGVWYLAATGDVATLQTYLNRFPNEVNRKFRGKTPVHVACTECYLGCLKLLLSYNPDLEITDDNGMRPIQVCAYSNFAGGARLLLDHGADINSKDGRQNTATMAAGALGHFEVLEVLLEHRLLNIHAGDHIGSTALHCAVIAKRDRAVKMLLEAGADPSIPNYAATTPLHDSAVTGYLASLEKMVAYFPQHINLEKCDDGRTPLHNAVIHNRLDVAHFLLSQPSCQMEHVMPDRGYTALHLAANQGHTALIELLVGYGANMNATSHDGSTPLMIVLTEKRMEPLCSRTPHLQQIAEYLVAGYGDRQRFDPYVIVACMLVQEGADPHIKTRLGDSPLQKCGSDVQSIIKLFAKERGTYRGSLKSKISTLPTHLKRRTTVPATEAAPDTHSGQAGFPKNLKEGGKPAVDPPADGSEGGGSRRQEETQTPATVSREGEEHLEEAAKAAVDRPAVPTESGSGSRRQETGAPAADGVSSESVRKTESLGAGGKSVESGDGGGRGGGEGVQSHSSSQSAVPTPSASRQDSDDGLCCLCDKMINTKLVPCGHSVMCKECATIPMRCPKCKERIKGSIFL